VQADLCLYGSVYASCLCGLTARGDRVACLAQREPEIVIPGKAGVPVYINGIDASWGIVEGEFGLDRPGLVAPRVTYRPLIVLYPTAKRTRLLPEERPAPRLWPAGNHSPAGSAAAAAGADLLPELVIQLGQHRPGNDHAAELPDAERRRLHGVRRGRPPPRTRSETARTAT